MKFLSRLFTIALCIGALLGAAVGAQAPSAPGVANAQATPSCRISGRVTSGNTPLPGVSITVRAGDALKIATSTDIDGTYAFSSTPGAAYHLSAEFTGFTTAATDVTVGAPAVRSAVEGRVLPKVEGCDQTVDLELTLRPRTEPLNTIAADRNARPPSQAVPDNNEMTSPRGRGAHGDARGRGGAAGGGDAAARGGSRANDPAQRFQALHVQSDAAAAVLETAPTSEADEVGRLLPSGFSLENAQADAIAVTGSNAATNLDRGLMNDRLQMVNLGQLDPVTGQFAPGVGPQDFGFGRGGFGVGPGGPEGFTGAGRGGPGAALGGGPGAFMLGGRGARGQRPYQGSATYTFGGSVLDSPPYQLRSDVPVTQPAFAQNTFGATFGGLLRIPGFYANRSRRTNIQLNYTGSEANNVFDQYATVPTLAQRNGDFSSTPVQLIDPITGQPFSGNQIPASRIDPSAAALLGFIPEPNLPGSTRNFHLSTTAHTSSEAVSIRMMQNLSRSVDQTRSRGSGRGGGVGFGGGFGGRGGAPGSQFGPGTAGAGGTSVLLTGQLQYRQNNTQGLNVFPDLGNDTTNTNLTAPISLIVRRGRSLHNVTVNLTRATTETANAFANTENVSALAGIRYPGSASTDPLNWGVPNLAFNEFTAARSVPASSRVDDRLTASYVWIHPANRHQVRMGGDYRLDRADATINSNSRGTFTFTGIYASGGAGAFAGGADFADFLLGAPQQATLQVGGTTRLRQHAVDAFVEDNWQKSSKLTFNVGVRYELARPYVEADGRMSNLDITPGFTAAAPVLPGAAGPFTGMFPPGLLNTDTNNLGPRLGFAYRLQPTTILRGGYSITYNSGSYASIARQLAGQPPFAETETVAGRDDAPLTLAEALLSPASTTTNNWGADKDYTLGLIQTWNSTITRNFATSWTIQAGYTGIKGTDLDTLRAPALGPGGVLIAGTQPFIWESSGGHSLMNAGTIQIRRRLAGGYSGSVSYTVAKAMDNASSLGAGGPVVAQNDKDLDAEWALSSFDRRQQLAGNFYLELPWGPDRRWLKNGGALAALVGEWSAQMTFTLQSGTPLTARVLGAASDLLRGVNGSLRANYNGAPISLSDPTVDEFFNVNAFSIPAPGEFGDAARNGVPGPGTRQLNALFQRDVRLGGTRSLTLQLNAINLLNTVQWAAVDTNINSRTFGQVLAARPMRTMTATARLRF
jgi:trimeric autotransporter adhesin